MPLPTDPKTRKQAPVYTGFMKYFPRAIFAVANLSFVANEQHNPGQPVHWNKSKSTDNLDAQMRHVLDQAIEEGGKDTDEILHLTKNAWRAMAALEIFLEQEEQAEIRGRNSPRTPKPREELTFPTREELDAWLKRCEQPLNVPSIIDLENMYDNSRWNR